MQTLNLKQLEAFVAVVESGSFTAAADRLFLAQSTISGHVAALEKDLGVALLLRTGRRQVALTEEGRRVYAHARTILQSCGELSRDLEEHKSQELSMAASSIPMQYILPRLLADFSGIMPQCRFSLRGGDSEAVQRIVLSGEVQLGFAGAVFSGRDLHQDLLAQDSLVLVAPDTEEYRDLRQAGTPGNLLLDRPLIVRENGSGTQQAADRFLAENGFRSEDLHIVAHIQSSEAMLRAVACGLGCALVSGLAAASNRHVISFPLLGKETERRLYMIRPRDRRLTRPAQAFIDFVLASIH